MRKIMNLSLIQPEGMGAILLLPVPLKTLIFLFSLKISVGGNSGIKYFLLPNTSLGCEYQVIDDNKHPDAKLGINGNRKTGALYDVMPPDLNKHYKPAGEWNTARIVVKDNHAEHWLNGIKILDYERGSEAFKQALQKANSIQQKDLQNQLLRLYCYRHTATKFRTEI